MNDLGPDPFRKSSPLNRAGCKPQLEDAPIKSTTGCQLNASILKLGHYLMCKPQTIHKIVKLPYQRYINVWLNSPKACNAFFLNNKLQQIVLNKWKFDNSFESQFTQDSISFLSGP